MLVHFLQRTSHHISSCRPHKAAVAWAFLSPRLIHPSLSHPSHSSHLEGAQPASLPGLCPNPSALLHDFVSRGDSQRGLPACPPSLGPSYVFVFILRLSLLTLYHEYFYWWSIHLGLSRGGKVLYPWAPHSSLGHLKFKKYFLEGT